MLVKSIMTSDVQSCGPDASLSAAARIMAKRDCGVVPVVDARRKLLGVITDRDVSVAVATRFQSPEEIRVAEVMAKKIHTCAPDDDVRTALNLMRNHTVRRVPVVMADGHLAGIISIDDLVLRADSRAGAAVEGEEVLDALKAICAHTMTARPAGVAM